MLRRQRVYLAGQVCGDDFAYRKFETVEKRLTNCGFAVLNPLRIVSQLPKDVLMNEDECAKVKNSILSLCSDIVVLDGYEDSEEVKKDLEYASQNNIDITYEKDVRL